CERTERLQFPTPHLMITNQVNSLFASFLLFLGASSINGQEASTFGNPSPTNPPNIQPPSGDVTNGTVVTITAPGEIRFQIIGKNLPDSSGEPVITGGQETTVSAAFPPVLDGSLPYVEPIILRAPLFTTNATASVTVIAFGLQPDAPWSWNTN